MKFLGITFDSQLTFQKHFEDILDRCNIRCNRLKLLFNQKWRPSSSTIIQIYKQFVRPIFEYGSLSTITTSDNIITKIQRLQNKFIRLALCLPKYICFELLYDSAGLLYVKPLPVVRPISIQVHATYWGNFLLTPIAAWNWLSGLYADMFGTVLGLRI